jgi:tetratricopeptide (TPR) repeat protein
LQDLNRSVELAPEEAMGYWFRGVILQQLQRYEEALQDLNRSVELAPENGRGYRFRGEVLTELGLYESALEDHNRLLDLQDYVRTDGLNLVGLTLSHLRRYEEASSAYREVLASEPNSAIALYNLAVVSARWKGLSEAKAELDRARMALSQLNDPNLVVVVHYGLGGLDALENKTESALQFLAVAVASSSVATRWAKHDIAWLDLRDDPRFREVIELGGPKN